MAVRKSITARSGAHTVQFTEGNNLESIKDSGGPCNSHFLVLLGTTESHWSFFQLSWPTPSPCTTKPPCMYLSYCQLLCVYHALLCQGNPASDVTLLCFAVSTPPNPAKRTNFFPPWYSHSISHETSVIASISHIIIASIFVCFSKVGDYVRCVLFILIYNPSV